MRLGQKKNSAGTAVTRTDTTGGKGPITRDNYVARFMAYPKTSRFVARNENARDGQLPTHAQFHAWMVWFDARGVLIKSFQANGTITVPTEWPEDFDQDFYPSDREWQPPVREVISAEKRAEMVRRLKEFSDSLRMKSDRRRNNPREPAETPHQVLARLSESSAKSPLTIGPHLAEYLQRKPFVGQSAGAEDYGEIR